MPDTLTVEYVDPSTVATGKNIRRDIRLSGERGRRLVESVRARGVRTPCPATRTADGIIVLEFGSRRRAAAIEAGKPLPVIVLGDYDDSDAAQLDRLFDQFDENEHREPLTAQEQAGFVQALLDFNVPEGQIRKRTGWDKDVIGQARRVAASEKVMAAPPIEDLEMAATIADFAAADDTEAVETLEEAVALGPGQFRHAAQLLIDTQAERFGKRDLLAQLAEAGITVLAEDDNGIPVTPDGIRVGWQQRLTDWQDAKGNNLTPKNHAKCPGHAVHLNRGWGAGNSRKWEPVYMCTDPEGNGHKSRYGNSRGKKPASEAAKEAAARQRRIVIDYNKQWRAARTVRQNWLKELLARRTVPDGALPVIFGALSGCWFDRWDRSLSDAISGGHGLACDLLGLTVKVSDPEAVAAALRAASPARQQVIALGLILAAWETTLTDDTWRRYADGTPEHQHYRDQTSVAGHYLLLLESWGYGLSEVEKLPAAATRAALDVKDAKPDDH